MSHCMFLVALVGCAISAAAAITGDDIRDIVLAVFLGGAACYWLVDVAKGPRL